MLYKKNGVNPTKSVMIFSVGNVGISLPWNQMKLSKFEEVEVTLNKCICTYSKSQLVLTLNK